MLLGTFQVDQEYEWSHSKFTELTEYLGYYPRFCFKAENPTEVIKNGLLVAPNSVDNLFIFDASDYKMLNSVYWNRFMITKADSDLKNSLSSDDPMHSEYLVSDLTNIKYQLRPQKWMPKGPKYISSFVTAQTWIAEDFGETSDIIKFCHFMAKEESHFIEKHVKPSLNRVIENPYERVIAALQLFKMDYLFFHYAFNTMQIDFRKAGRDEMILKDRLSQIPVFNWEKYLDTDIRTLIARFSNYDAPLEDKTVEMYDTICKQIDNCFSFYRDYM